MKNLIQTGYGCLTALILGAMFIGCGEETVEAFEDEERVVRIRGEEPEDEMPTLGGPPAQGQPTAENPADLGNGNAGQANGGSEQPAADQQAGNLGTPADEAGLTCNEIYGCFRECGEGEQDCLDACFQSGHMRAQAAVRAISECIQENACQDNECLEQSCGQVIAECDAQDRAEGSQAPAQPNPPSQPGNAGQPGGQGAPDGQGAPGGQGPRGGQNGGLLCNDIFGCYADCGGNQDCIAECYQDGTDSGRRAVDGIGACIHANQCQDQACVTENCGNQIRICDNDDGVERLNQPSGRDLTCTEIESCFAQCPANDERCNDTCYNSGSAEARQALSAVGACIRRFDCQTDACVENSCAQQVQACDTQLPGAEPADNAPGANAPGGNAPGAGNGLECQGIYQCSNECQGDDACRQRCFERGSAQGQAEARAVSECVQQNQCRDDECARTRCAQPIQACETPDAPGAGGQPDPGGLDGQAPPVEENAHNAEEDLDDEDANENPAQDQNLEADGTCEAPEPLAFGQHAGSTRGAPEAERGQCGGSGAEMVYSFTVEAQTQVCVNTTGSALDTVLYVRANQCNNAQAEVACNDDARGVQSAVTLMANPGTTYFVVVDSYNASGDFTLNVQPGVCP